MRNITNLKVLKEDILFINPVIFLYKDTVYQALMQVTVTQLREKLGTW
jgi:hypothetical protein